MAELQLVQPTVDQPTVDALTKLLEDARRGSVVGVAYVALHHGSDYSGDVVGQAEAHPLFTLGIARALEDVVAARTRKPRR